ncbi:hypothetical protein [Acanthopleuribacter pedis]|uniref:Uncharacterized protein n=1 Tax=Acanthopleuribacter pedis TaxID=442870 RepID=A0A8J7QFV8_9BACT|nr:hypothetical protein [Acanthopleuribacter pedis]MBO1317725.1 hypothetical protein [Acanthopleuribacter pedis]
MEKIRNAKDLQVFLNKHVTELEQALDISPVQFCIPLNKKRPHVRVSVTQGQKDRVPKELAFDFNGEQVLIPLEAVEDYQEFVAF